MSKYKAELMDILERLEEGQHETLEHEEDSYFDGYTDVHDCTITVLQSINGKYETVAEYELALDWSTIVEYYNGED